MLIGRVRQGEGEVFYDLIQPIYADLYRMAYIYVQNEHEAIEIIQQSMIRGYEKIGQLLNPEYFKTWMIRIVINCSKTYIAKMNRLQVTDPMDLQDLQSVTNDFMEEEMDLWQALQMLEEKYKTVLVLRFYQDLTVADIAPIVDLPEGTVKTNIRRGLLQLKQLLKGAYVDEWLQSVESSDQ